MATKKKCPFCAELIKSEAIKCRYCGEFLDDNAQKEASAIRKTGRETFGRTDVADYLHVPVSVVDKWVRKKQMPFSQLSGGRVLFRKGAIDRWIGQGDVTEYSRYVSSCKTPADILPEGYKPPTLTQEALDYAREIHEKYIVRHAKKEGVPVEEYAKGMKKEGVLRRVTFGRGPDGIRFDWDSKKKKYLVTRGEELYKRVYKKDSSFQAVLHELSMLMIILDHWY